MTVLLSLRGTPVSLSDYLICAAVVVATVWGGML